MHTKKQQDQAIVLLVVIVIAVAVFFGGRALLFPKRTDKRLDKSLPRTMRLNNPGGIIQTSIPWLGKVPHSENPDTFLEMFIDYPHGTRAMIKQLIAYIRSGRDTLNEIIPRWSGTTGLNYIAFVEQNASIDRNNTIVPTKTNLRKLVKAMAHFEAGRSAVTNSEFEAGYKLAF